MTKKYTSPRPYIKASVTRGIRLEANCRCAMCKREIALVRHHIDGNRENNQPENLILLCSICHYRADRGDITKLELLERKKELQRESEKIGEPSALEKGLAFQKKDKIVSSLSTKQSEILQALCYLPFLYLSDHFYTDQRGNKLRKRIRNLLSIDAKKEDLFLTKLKSVDLIGTTGNLLYLKNKKLAKELLNELINTNKIDLDKITNLFLN